MSQTRKGATLRVGDLTVSYTSEPQVVSNVSFEVPAGKLLTLLGPSGAGKTTILGAINGDLAPDGFVTQGNIILGGKDITYLPLNERGIGRVYQKHSLWDHMSVFKNIAFPLYVRHVPRRQIREKVRSMLELVKLDHIQDVEERSPSKLSGGQQRRVALARALVFDPSLLLLDEPLEALDRNLREEMQNEIRELQKNLEITTIYVTHDQTEALSMSDTVAVVKSGKIIRIGTPFDIYTNPEEEFVADFLGASNIINGVVLNVEANSCTVRTFWGDSLIATHKGTFSEGDNVRITVRPEAIQICDNSLNCANHLLGELSRVLFLGGTIKCNIEIRPNISLTAVFLNRGPLITALVPGRKVRLGWNVEDCRIIETTKGETRYENGT